MTPDEQATAIVKMEYAATKFYAQALLIQNHPFIEFAGLLNEYISMWRWCTSQSKSCKWYDACSILLIPANAKQAQRRPPLSYPEDVVQSAELAGI